MRLPRMTTRRLMALVAAVAVAMTAERILFIHAAGMVSSGPGEGCLWHEAVGAWVVLNVVLAIIAVMIVAVNRGD